MILVIGFSGFKAYNSIPREAAPDIQIPLLIVTIPFPGASNEFTKFSGILVVVLCSIGVGDRESSTKKRRTKKMYSKYHLKHNKNNLI